MEMGQYMEGDGHLELDYLLTTKSRGLFRARSAVWGSQTGLWNHPAPATQSQRDQPPAAKVPERHYVDSCKSPLKQD